MTPKTFLIIMIVVIIALLGFGAWYYFFHNQTTTTTGTNSTPSGFEPLNRPASGSNQAGTSSVTNTNAPGTTTTAQSRITVLRLLSNTPIGGYGALTTATTTVVRWIDRGRGNIYEVKENASDVTTLSNIILPRVYNSSWNKNLTSFIGQALEDSSELPASIYAELTSLKTATTTKLLGSNLTPFELKGVSLPDNVTGYAVSPNKSRIFFLIKGAAGSKGYVANFDGSKMTQIFTTPLTQLNIEWPSDNIIAITTKGTADRAGYMYFVDPKTGVWKKILGPLNGLSTKVSRDAKYVLLSVTGMSDNVVTGLYSLVNNKPIDGAVSTLADKCVWGNFYKEIVYCAVPSQMVSGTYPDDWYKGTLQTVDDIWQINAITGETKFAGKILGQAGRVIDAFNLGLDDKDNFLFFMNKYDLSFWSLDLVKSQ